MQGIRHILFGADHMLFVLGLLLIVKDRWMLLKTVTAFTVAHSITLAIATLGYAEVPVLPLNAAIALSILFLGPEIVRSWRGETSFTIRHPWVVAFAFGLLHGFGFASALTSAGLPRHELPLALVSFNVGVELGQLGFIALILALERSFRILEVRWPRWARRFPDTRSARSARFGPCSGWRCSSEARDEHDRDTILWSERWHWLCLCSCALRRPLPTRRKAKPSDSSPAFAIRSRDSITCWRWLPSDCGARNSALRRFGFCRSRFPW